MTFQTMTFRTLTLRTTLGAATLAVAAAAALAAPAFAAEPLARAETAKGSDAADVAVISATRRDGILTVALRFTAQQGMTGFGGFALYTTPNDGYEQVYLVAGDKKYFAMKDSEGKPLIPETFVVSIDQGKGRTLWSGRFAAPPPEVKAFALVLPFTSPLEPIAITDQ